MKSNRRNSQTVRVGDKLLGGNEPIVVQSMTNTPTEDIQASAKQIEELWEAGSELVRLTVNTREAAKAIPQIVNSLLKRNIDVPLIGDFHYNGHLLLTEFSDCARLLAKYRINPGNVGRGEKHDENFKRMIEIALKYDKPVRIGVNWGSLDQELLAKMMDENALASSPKEAQVILKEAIVASALQSARLAESYGMAKNKLVISAKVSEVPDLLDVYRSLADSCDYALHLGLTEAGMGNKGVVASTAALSILLSEGIGDTIRVSLTPRPGASRTEEVEVCQRILQSLGFRSFAPTVAACPGCGRTTSTVFQELAQEIEQHLAVNKKIWKEKYPDVDQLKVAVMGCIVNGPGESKHADIGISLPGTGEEPKAPVFIDGEHVTTLSGPNLTADFIALVNNYVAEKFSAIKV